VAAPVTSKRSWTRGVGGLYPDAGCGRLVPDAVWDTSPRCHLRCFD